MQPNTLMARIFKAKYFPHSFFMESSLGSRPSFSWRSIFSAKDLLQHVLIWRVGNGQNIQVWGDRWLSVPVSYSVQSPKQLLAADATIASLINSNAKEWKADLVKIVLNAEEVQVVLNIPLSPSLPPDKLIWQGTKNGVFSVKSAYHLGKEIQQRMVGDCSHVDKEKDVWQLIWSLKIPNFVKHFHWRACKNILPTKTNLFNCNVVDSKLCPCCLVEEEDVLHAMWSCRATQDVWDSGPLIFQKSSFIGISFQQLLSFFSNRPGRDDLNLMAILSQRIWFRRNKLVFDDVLLHPSTVVQEAKMGLEVFLKSYASQLNKEVEPSPAMFTRRWQPPHPGTIKIN